MAKKRAEPAGADGPKSRTGGLLLHVTSLPGPYGIGDLGPEAYAWVGALQRAKQSWWQMLPLSPPGAGNSPYQAYSAFAGNPVLISPDRLVEEGFFRTGDVKPVRSVKDRVDFERVNRAKGEMLALAWERFGAAGSKKPRAAFDAFRKAEAAWLDDFTLFMALREAYGRGSWTEWPRKIVVRKRSALAEARRELAEATARHAFAQFLFFRQLRDLKAYANERGVGLIGDLPIYVSPESSDVWTNPHLFQLDRDRRPTAVAGVPPDFFSADGQRWGNPLYDWSAMRREKFEWWVARCRAVLGQADLVRIDHFRGFAGYWKIPANEPTAKGGRWVTAPGPELFDTLRRRLGGLPFIAEDLGVITPDVEALRDDNGLPGMRVVQFAYGGGGGDNPHLPHNHTPAVAAYTGTHDNDTTAGWYRALKAKDRAAVRAYLPGADRDPAAELIRATWSSVAALAVAPVQDLLGLNGDARMNRPGSATGNWGWRLAAPVPRAALDRLASLTNLYSRAPRQRDQKSLIQ